MIEKEYVLNIGDLKISGTAKALHRLATVYRSASCEYGHQITEEIHGKHRDKLINELINEQKELDNIEKQLIDTIRGSDYYKQFSSEMAKMIDDVLEKIEQNSSLTNL